MVRKVSIALLLVLAPVVAHADCRHLFQKQVVVQQVHAVYAQPLVAYAPPVYYAAGADIQAEALADKVMRLVDSRISQALRDAPQQVKQHKPAQQVSASVFAKCAACHTGPNAAGGLVLDGSTAVTCRAYFKFGQMFGQGKGVPPKMQSVVQSLTPAEKGAMNDALLDLVQEVVAPPSPSTDLE